MNDIQHLKQVLLPVYQVKFNINIFVKAKERVIKDIKSNLVIIILLILHSFKYL